MSASNRIFGRASGRVPAPLMFIGEAPGRLGADETTIPFHGDRAGENFERLLGQSTLSRYDCFVTNAVLCNPRDSDGNNTTPNRLEVNNCTPFLRTQIELVDPKIIVTLGGLALAALKAIEAHDYELASTVRRSLDWNGRELIPLYHPGQRAMVHRSFLNQLSDYRFVAERLQRSMGARIRKSLTESDPDVAAVAVKIIRASGEVSYFRLHKLLYLVEYHYFREKGFRLSSSYVIRQKDGPYFTDLHIRKLKKAIPNLAITTRHGSLMLSLERTSDLFEPTNGGADQTAEFINGVVKRYQAYSDARIKSAVYMTSPMRVMARQEKYGGINLLNAPILFSQQV
jgi:uracil-DNA glycosylase family 4